MLEKIKTLLGTGDPNKTQSNDMPLPGGPQPGLDWTGVVVSPDTRRERRIPAGQSRTLKWPVLDASGPPSIDLDRWRLAITGLVNREVELNWEEFQKLPRIRVFGDMHCVTRWSRLGNIWEGVSTRHLLDLAGGVKPQAKYVLAHGYDYGWTTNLPINDFAGEDCLVATHHDGEPLTPEHGGPARLMVPRLYAWKSAKWVAMLEVLEQDRAGFWERNGYHMHGDPWKEERFGFNG